MLSLVLAALRARRPQAFTLLLLSLLAAAAAAAAPWYVLASTERIATRQVEAATTEERTAESVAEGPIDGGSTAALLDAQAEQTRQIVGLSGFTTYTQALLTGTAGTVAAKPADVRETASPLALRTGACERAQVQGRCATGDREVMVSYRAARWLRVKPGDQLRYDATVLGKPVTLEVVGIYQPTDPTDPFWTSNADLLARDLPLSAPPEVTEPVDDAVLAGPAVFDKLQPDKLRTVVDLVAEPKLLVDNDAELVRENFNDATVTAANNRLTLNTKIFAILDRVERDRQLVSLGVPVGAFQLLLLCWFALYLAVKYTGEEHRPDIGLVKLRGVTGARTWALVGGQSGVPMVVGALLGLPVGYLVSAAVAGPIREPVIAAQAAGLSAAAAAVAVVGALFAALLAERQSLRASVSDLLRQASTRGRAWRDLFDLVLVVIAAVAVYQVKQRASGDIAGLGLLAPGLAALACALVASRSITAVAGRLVDGALRHGRPGRALTAIYLARRPGVHRLAALMIVTVALLGTSYLTWDAGARLGRERAELEVGADRVLNVRAENRLALLNAVRDVDPSGRQAMAVVESVRSGNDRVLLVDSPRLPAVAIWRPEYGLSAAQAAAALHPPAPDPVTVTAGSLHLDMTAHDDGSEPSRLLFLDAVFADPAGARVVARFGPLQNGRATLSAAVPTCAKAPGCRLSSLAIMQSTTARDNFFAARPGVDVTVHGLTGDGPVLSPAMLTDRTRWRLEVSSAPPNLIVSPTAGGLLLQVAPILPGPSADPGVYPYDAPAPIATIRAKRTLSKLTGDQRLTYGAASISERIVADASRLPRLGDQGVLADLEYADRLGADFGAGESMQVWLSPDAPRDIAGKLRDRHLLVIGEESIDGTAERYASFGPPLTLQFMLLSAVIGVALAIGAASVVAAVERRPRGAELSALRVQGAPAGLVRRVSLEGYLVLIGVSLLIGVALAVVLRAYIGDVLPYFADGWSAP